MIDQITKNNSEIESYYNIGSIHGDIRMMLSKYIYDEICLREIVDLYHKSVEEVINVNINSSSNTITFDIMGQTMTFQERFAKCMYLVVGSMIEKLNDCIDMFEMNNPKYKIVKDNINLLADEKYYITLFRTAYIKHEKSTSCIIQL